MRYDGDTRYLILCEDRQTACYLRYFLYGHGANSHKITVKKLAMGQGCGEQRVREKFPEFVHDMNSYKILWPKHCKNWPTRRQACGIKIYLFLF